MTDHFQKDYTINDDGSASFVIHHMCSATYGIPNEVSKRKIDYITKLIGSNAGEFLTNLLREDDDPFGSDILEIDKVYVSCGISELEPSRHTMFVTYYDKVQYNFILTIFFRTKVEANLVKLKKPKFFIDTINDGKKVLEEVGIESPVVFIEEFIFGHPKTKDMFAL